MMPRGLRPLKNEYIAIAKLLVNDYYLKLDETSFVAQFMKHTHGSGNPKRARQIYYELLKDAGI